MNEHPDWDPGAWDALSVDEKRKRTDEAPPRSASTWRDERGGDGSRAGLHRRRRRWRRCAVSWNTPPKRVDAHTLRLPGLGDIEVRAPNGLPEASRLRSARVCVRNGRRGRCRVDVHLSVRIDVEPGNDNTHWAVAGADMGCTDTLTLHDGTTLTLPDHDAALEKALKAQRAMNGCVRGSRQWTHNLQCLRAQRQAMQHRDHDAVRKAARAIARTCDVIGLESLNIKGMGASARTRSDTGVAAKRGAQPAHPRKPLGVHPERHRERDAGRRRSCAEAPRHRLKPDRRRVRARRRTESQSKSVPLHGPRASRRRRRERGQRDAPARQRVA